MKIHYRLTIIGREREKEQATLAIILGTTIPASVIAIILLIIACVCCKRRRSILIYNYFTLKYNL